MNPPICSALPTPCEQALFRLLKRFVLDEFARTHGQSVPAFESVSWKIEDRLDGPRVGLDSIGILSLAGTVSSFFQLQHQNLDALLLSAPSFKSWCQISAEAWQNGLKQIHFKTSGSQGLAKTVPKPVSELARETDEWATRFSHAKRLILCVPSHHIYGFLFGVLLPTALKIETLEASLWAPDRLQRELQPGDLIISHPTHWNLVSDFVDSLPPDIAGVTSTSPMDKELRARLQEQGLSEMTEIFGSTETGGIGFRAFDSGGWYQLLPYWNLNEEATHLISTSDDSKVEIQDSLTWLDARRFVPQGRKDKLVQVSGINVSLSHVERQIENSPLVSKCSVRHTSSKNGGHLRSFIVPSLQLPESENRQATLFRWCSENLKPEERPTHYTFGESLPQNSLGKSIDWI